MISPQIAKKMSRLEETIRRLHALQNPEGLQNRPDESKTSEELPESLQEDQNQHPLHLQLKDGPKLLVENICKRIQYEMGTRRISITTMAERVLGKPAMNFFRIYIDSKLGTLNDYEKMYDWLMLSEDEKEKSLKKESAPEPLPLIDSDNKVLVDNLKIRLYFELKARKLHRQQFAPRVLQRSDRHIRKLFASGVDWEQRTFVDREHLRLMVKWIGLSEEEKEAVWRGDMVMRDSEETRKRKILEKYDQEKKKLKTAPELGISID